MSKMLTIISIGSKCREIQINGDDIFSGYTKKFEFKSAAAWDIFDAYKRPSFCKVNTWNVWKNLFDDINTCDNVDRAYIFISGFNSCMFTIMGEIILNDGAIYKIKITRDNIYIY